MSPVFADRPVFAASMFATPNRLWLLILVCALIALYVTAELKRPKVTARFTNLALLESVVPKRDVWKRHVAAGCFTVGVALLVLALAHPQRTMKVPTNRATVVLAIDTSLSMEATDVSPSRFAAAKDAANLFLTRVPPQMNIGIVSFNGTATVQVTPTKDRDAARRAIDSLQLGERTAIGEAIFASLDAIKTVPPAKDGSPVPARIVLMSDGSTTWGRSNASAVAAARKAHVPIDTIAFGTDHGTVMVPESPLPVPVNVDRAALEGIARDAGGHAFTAASEAQIRDVYKNIGTSIGYRTVRKDISGWYEGAALVLLFAAAGASLAWSSRML